MDRGPGSRHFSLARSFRKMLLDYLLSSREAQSISREEEILLDEATKEQLRNLGYIH
jgi:hypothetical protein